MKSSKILFLLSIILFLLSFFWLLKSLFLGLYPDFGGYYYGAKLMLSGKNPYLGGNGLYTTYVYPPIVLLLFMPALLLPFFSASFVWAVLNIILLLAGIFLLSKILNVKFFSTNNLFISALIFIFFPTKFSIGMGQINILILFFLILTILFINKNKDFLAGIFLGLSISIKLFPLFLPVYLLIKLKEKRGILIPWTRVRVWIDRKQFFSDLQIIDGILLVLILSILFTVLFVPEVLYREFLTNTLPGLINSWKTDYYNQALSGFIARGLGVSTFANVVKLITAGIITLITLFILTKNEKEGIFSTSLKFGTLITLSVIVNNFSWQHHFVWLIIPFYTTFFYLKKIKANFYYYFLLAISYVLIAINFKNPLILPTFLQSHVLFGALILLSLDLYLIYKKA